MCGIASNSFVFHFHYSANASVSFGQPLSSHYTLYLHQYFATNKRLLLPGIGTFETSYTPADLDFVNCSLKGTCFYIIFHAEEKSDETYCISCYAKPENSG